MKNFLLYSFLMVNCSFIFAQGFDDMPYNNPDMPTWFQQEMTSLMKFQAENNTNIPFFVSGSIKLAGSAYSDAYLDSLLAPYGDLGEYRKQNLENNILLGGQIKINNMFYIPLFVQIGTSNASTINPEYEVYEGTFFGKDSYKKVVAIADHGKMGAFCGGGLFINTKRIQGGIYLGASLGNFSGGTIRMPYSQANGVSGIDTIGMGTSSDSIASFKMALAPLVDTSDFAVVGKALSSIIGYLGMGNIMYAPDEDKKDSKTSAFIKTLNTALGFSFNKIEWGPFTLNINALYTRGYFDSSAKTDTYGAKLLGLFPGKPFGFSFEGGYKHFYAVSRGFEKDYTDGPYFLGSIFFPFKKITFGFIYQYNNIYGSTYTIALSTNFLHYFMGLSPNTRYASGENFEANPMPGMNAGFRYRHGGWKTNKE